MKKLIYVPFVIMALLLSACGTTTEVPEGLLSGDPAAADSFLGEATTVEERSLRLHFAVFAYAKLGSHRVFTADPQDAAAVLGNVIKLRQAVVGFQVENPDPYFVETDIRDTALSLINVIVDVAEDTVTKAAFSVLDGLDFATARKRFALRAEQAALLQAIIMDIRRNLDSFRNGEFTYAEVTTAINNRLDSIQNQLASFQ